MHLKLTKPAETDALFTPGLKKGWNTVLSSSYQGQTGKDRQVNCNLQLHCSGSSP